MFTVATIIGARPQFVKASAVSRAFRASGVREVLIHTGQHYDPNLSRVFFDELDIPEPQFHLGSGSGPHGRQTGMIMERCEAVLEGVRPDYVIVYGDTNSTLAGALTAAKMHIPVAHIEAGLRSFDRRMPEEINRVVTDHVSDILFAPTDVAVKNLRNEGIRHEKIVISGDVMYDVALYYSEKSKQRSTILFDLSLKPKTYCLATVHRAENTDDPEALAELFKGLRDASSLLPVIVPLHPRTRSALQKIGFVSDGDNLKLVDPVGYLDMIALEKNAACIATDSGGVQKEAFFFEVPCVTLREHTEWTELIDCGYNRLVPIDSRLIRTAIAEASASRPAWGKLLYGRGDSADLIASKISQVAAVASAGATR